MQKQTSILLVDDHAMLRKGLRALIEQEPGLTVIEEAENGQEAIEKVRKLQPDVVVMDINMPRLNGIEATRQIFAENPDCRILALSIHSTRRYVEEMLEAGVAGYLLKESAPEELLAAIHALRDGKGYLSKDITELVIEKVRETAAAAAATNGSRSDSRKWRKPELTDGLIHRRDLVLRLENEHHKFLTLLVAPAGYGKSTLVCDWLNRHRHPHLWWSIGPEDNDLRRFCESWVAMTAEPLADRPRHLPALVEAANLPPVSILAGALVAELAECPEDLTIVLENMHLLKDKAIFDLLSRVLTSPIESKRFVIITRQDPFLPISSLRANHQLCELRTRDLEFSARDVQSYLETALARGIDAETAASWQERTEGWVTGLQLAVNTLAGQKDDAPEKVRVEQVNWRTVLTNREYEILLLLQERLRDKEIADRLCISAETVKTHLKNIYGKLQAGDRRDAVTRAQQLNIL
ncbi:MAG: response regulator [Desulfuromonadales bacterium]|jgi:DNA-binding NarL/FixJ family response regulator